MPDLLFADAIEKLKTTVQQGRSLDAAQVRVVGLDDIRIAAGDQWNRIKERVRTNSLEFIRRHLSAADIVIPAGDGFLVLYASAPGRDLARQSESLQEALSTFYLGEEATAKLQARVRDVSIDASNMYSILSEATDVQSGAPGPQERAQQPAIERRMDHDLVFTPVWSVAHEAIGMYFVTVASFERRGARVHGYDPMYRAHAKHSGQSFLDIDLLALKTAVDAAGDALASGKKCLVGCSVHSTTLRSRASRADYLRTLADTPEPLRKYISVRIAEVEPGVPLVTLTEWIGALRAVISRVSVELHPSEPNLTNLSETGASTFCCDLPITCDVTPEQRRRYGALMARWSDALHRQNLQFNVNHVIDAVLFDVARRVGVDLVSSERLWPTLDAPAGILKYSAAKAAATFAQCVSADEGRCR